MKQTRMRCNAVPCRSRDAGLVHVGKSGSEVPQMCRWADARFSCLSVAHYAPNGCTALLD